MSNSKPNVRELFCRALECESPESLDEFLSSACEGNVELRQRVEHLLESRKEIGEFLGGTAVDEGNETEEFSTTIGPYKLLEPIGEGGMGTVYMAEQTEPVHRRVALKLIKTGMDTKQVIARFEAERQALALMDHPNIAKVLDAGATDFGRPYFVMELVKGVPINKYCDEHQLDPKQRLELFKRVCHAVQHAHQKGIIHRDLKPSNIMVALYDDKPVPKVIDFGVAKATGEQLTEKTVFTRFGQVLGTLEYMSPEQTQLNQLDVDTRSDIYSLGAILYELLSGSPPFEAATFKKVALDEVFRIIREQEPSKPSTKLSTAETLPEIATDRHTQPKKLSALLQGDLDWIVMKALEKDRTRRYETANGFAIDIERYLKDEPVSAGPPSAAYRLRKFARRNSGMLLAGSIIAALLVVGTGVSTWQAIRAVKAEKLAKSQAYRASVAETNANSEAVRANQEANEAKKANEIAMAVQEFFNKDILLQASPYNQKHDITLVEVLNLAGNKVGSQFPNQPLVEAEIREALFKTYKGLGEYEKARFHAEKTKELRETHLGKKNPKTLYAATMFAHFRNVLGKDVDQEVANLERIVETCEIQLGVKDVVTQNAIYSLAYGYVKQGKLEPAKKRYQWLVDNSVDPERTVQALFNVAVISDRQGMLDEVLRLTEVALSRAKELGDDHHLVSRARTRLAVFYGYVGEFEKAISLLQQSWESQKEVLGSFHPKTLETQKYIAAGLTEISRFEQAEKHYLFVLENLGDVQDVLTEKGTWSVELGLSENYRLQGRYAEAEVLARGILERAELSLNASPGYERHRIIYETKLRLANILADAGRHRQAILIYDEIIRNRQEILEQDPKDSLNARELVISLNNQAITFRELHDHEHEAMLFERAAKIQRSISDLATKDLDSYRKIGSLLMEQGNATKAAANGRPSETYTSLTPTPEAVKHLENALSIYEEQAEPILLQVLDRDPDNQKTQTLLVRYFENKAEVLQRLKRYFKSVAAMEQCFDLDGRDAAENLKLDIYNCEMRAREGDHRAAASQVAEIVAANDAMDSWLPILVYAVCSRTVLNDESLSAEESRQSSNRYESLAIESLQDVVNNPDGITADRLESLVNLAEFEALRTRKEFQQLVEKMEIGVAAKQPTKIDQNKIPRHKRRMIQKP